MSYSRRRLLSITLSSVMLLSMILSLIAPSWNQVSAQDAPDDPSPAQPEGVEPEPAEENPLPTPIDAAFTENFDDGDVSDWLLNGWAVAPEANGNGVLISSQPAATATVNGLVWDDAEISARIGLTPGNTANVSFRVGAEAYTVTLDSAGTAYLFRGTAFVAQGEAGETPAEALMWYTLTIRAESGNITAAVDGEWQINFTDSAPLPAGWVVFSTGGANTGTVALDDIDIQSIRTPVVVIDPSQDEPAEPDDLPEPIIPDEVIVIEESGEGSIDGVIIEPDSIDPMAIASGVPVLAADFETLSDQWVLSDGAGTGPDGENMVAGLTPGASLYPNNNVNLGNHTINVRVKILTAAETGVADGISIFFRASDSGAYLLTFETTQTELYRKDGSDYTLLSKIPAQRSLNTWYSIQIDIADDKIRFFEDGVAILTYVDENPISSGQLSFVANGSNVLLDDVFVYSEDILTEMTASTIVPYSLNAATRAKLSGAFLNTLETYLGGDTDSAMETAQNYFMPMYSQNRFRLHIWAADGVATSVLATQVQGLGGVVKYVEAGYVEAYISLDDVLAIAQLEAVAAVTLADVAVSTSNDTGGAGNNILAGTGTVWPHSMDILGVNSWHIAGYEGGSVNIAVIDTGFVEAGSAAERACLGSTVVEVDGGAGSGSNGLQVVEVLCDIAPKSAVWMYQATNANELITMVNRAAQLNNQRSVNNFPQADVIVITMDPGATTSFADAVNAAVANNIPVIVSAGNAGNNAAFAVGFSGGEASFTIRASAGSVISYSWDNTNDYTSQLLAGEMVVDSLPMNTGSSNNQYRVPNSCGASCELTLTIQGEAPANFDVRIAGGNETVNEIALGADLVPLASGSLTELASLDSVISVGAVCSWQAGNGANISRYQILPTSSTGAPGQPNNATIKPNVVAPSLVSTSLAQAAPECDLNAGFGGTAAAAAHVGGMGALLMSNPYMQGIYQAPVGVPSAVRNYLQTRTIDLHTGANPDGFDNVYGAGLVQLGNPTFNLGLQQVIVNPANAVAGSAYYVSTSRVPISGAPDGSAANPFMHPALAIQEAIDNNILNVVFMPGEYVTSFRVNDPGVEGLTVTSFDAVDTADWFPSAIWVNDTFQGSSGISLNNVQNVRIVGFQFTGSTPLYEALLPPGETSQSLQIAKVTPLDVTLSTNILIRSNSFVNFDAPIVVDRSNAVTFGLNAFTSFEVPVTSTFIDGQQSDVPLYSSAVMRIIDSGQTTPIRYERNNFTNNIMPVNLGTQNSAFQEAIIGIERSGVEIFNSKFLNNSSEGLISINQWNPGEENPGTPADGTFVTSPITIFGSWFDSNVLDKSLVQLYLAETFRFINNTVTNHNLQDAGFGSIIGLGHEQSVFLNFTDHRYDILNNLFYNNVVRGKFVGNANFSMGNDACIPIGGSPGASPNPTNNSGARSNWFAPAFTFGDCSVSVGISDGTSDAGNAPQNNNIFTNMWEGVSLIAPGSPTPEELAASEQARAAFSAFYFFTSANDPNNPYRLRPTPDELQDPPPTVVRVNLGVDTGETAPAQAVPNVPFTDLFGFPRVVDRPPDASPGTEIDRGAYELGNPSPVSFAPGGGSVKQIVNEDTIVTIPLRNKLEGGFEPYRFVFSGQPTVYDTNPLSACGGQPYSLNPQTYVLTYCPPADFYNNGLTTTYPQANIVFQYEAFGLLDSQGTGTAKIEIIINPVPETQPLNPTAPTKVLFVDSTTELRYRLEPWASFNTAGNLEFSHPDPSIFEQSPDVDLPLTHTAVAIDTAATLFNPQIFNENYPVVPGDLTAQQISEINAMLDAALSNGVFEMNTPGGFLPVIGETGAFEFTYTVTDVDGQIGTRRTRIRVTERKPGDGDPGDGSGGPGSPGDPDDPDGGGGGPGPGGGAGGPGGRGPSTEIVHIGMFDEASLNFQYSDGWEPFYYQLAINETIHYTTGANQSVTFSFDGDAFAIHWLGYPNGGGYTLEIDHDDDGIFTPYNDASLNLVCTGGSKPNTLSTNISTIQTFTFGCSGLDLVAPDMLRTLRITSTSAAAIILDAIEVRGTNLLPGFYSDDDFAMTYSNAWTPFDLIGARGDTIHYTGATGQTVRFNVDGDTVDSMIVYYISGPGFGSLEVRYNGQLVQTIDTDSFEVNLGQAKVIPGIGDGPAQVELRTTSDAFVLLEAVELLGPRASLKPGFYSLTNPRFRVAGNWVSIGPYDVPGMQIQTRTGEIFLNTEPDAGGLAFTVDATQVTRMVIHYGNDFFWGSMQICGVTCTNPLPTGGVPRPFTTTLLSDLGITGDSAPVAINVVDGWIGLEAIELLPAPGNIAPGYYDQYRDSPDILYNGSWNHVFDATARDGTASWADTADDTMVFSVPGSIDGIVVYHSFGAGIEICANDGSQACFTINNPASGAKVYGGRTYVTRTDLGLAAANATITIRAASATPVAIEGLHIVSMTNSGLRPLSGARVTPYNGDLRYVGQWESVEAPGPVDNILTYSVLPNTAVLFEIPDGEGVTVHHTSGLGRGSFEICIDITTCQIINASALTEELKWSTTTTALSTGGTGKHLVEIRSLDNWLGLEAIGIVGATQTLGRGAYDDANPNLRYSGSWTLLQDPTANGYAVRSGSGTAQVMFTVDTTNAGRLAVHHLSDSRWGQMEVCIDAVCQTVNQTSAANGASIFGFAAGVPGVVTITPQSGSISFDGVEVLPGTTALATGFYDETDPNLVYSGTWLPYQNYVFNGGAILFAQSTAAVTFNVNANVANTLAIHHPTGSPLWGTLRVCGPGNACQNIDMATQGPVSQFAMSDLNLTGDSAPVTIERVSGYVALDGIELTSTTVGMPPGFYEDYSIALALTSTEWTTYPGGFSGGSFIYTTTPNATISFTIGGGVKDVDPAVTGFTLFFGRLPQGAPFEVCYTRQSNGRESCATGSTVFTLPEFPGMYGFSYRGFAPLTTAGTANETYAVTLRNTGTAGQVLLFEGVAVMGRPSVTMGLNPDGTRRTYDDSDAGIVYGPELLWASGGGIPGLYKGTYTYNSTAGATAQIRMRGNALTMYQIPYTGGSLDVEFCLVVGNEINSGVQCNNYALYNPAGGVIPSAITLYGFGFGTRDLIIENRDTGGSLFIDAVEVR